MRVVPLAACFFLFWSQPSPQLYPPPAPRDPQAVSLLQASVRAMGGGVPSDSTAAGTVTIVAGSLTSNGTIRILTRGTFQTLEQITLPQETRTTVFSEGNATETLNGSVTNFSMERSVSSQSLCFPLPFLAAALDASSELIQYIGAETFGQQSVQHVRIRNTFSSDQNFQRVSDLTTADIWLDATSNLPQKISIVRRDARGPATPQFLIDFYFSNYQSFSGTYYPFQINISLNGTPWKSIAISSVQFSTGLSDSDFPVQ